MRMIVDYRERNSGLVELLQGHCETEIGNLICGDYLINNQVLVERKTTFQRFYKNHAFTLDSGSSLSLRPE